MAERPDPVSVNNFLLTLHMNEPVIIEKQRKKWLPTRDCLGNFGALITMYLFLFFTILVLVFNTNYARNDSSDNKTELVEAIEKISNTYIMALKIAEETVSQQFNLSAVEKEAGATNNTDDSSVFSIRLLKLRSIVLDGIKQIENRSAVELFEIIKTYQDDGNVSTEGSEKTSTTLSTAYTSTSPSPLSTSTTENYNLTTVNSLNLTKDVLSSFSNVSETKDLESAKNLTQDLLKSLSKKSTGEFDHDLYELQTIALEFGKNITDSIAALSLKSLDETNNGTTTVKELESLRKMKLGVDDLINDIAASIHSGQTNMNQDLNTTQIRAGSVKL